VVNLKKLTTATVQGNFGNPVSGTTSYAICIYDQGAALRAQMQVNRAGHLCGTKACWSAISNKGLQVHGQAQVSQIVQRYFDSWLRKSPDMTQVPAVKSGSLRPVGPGGSSPPSAFAAGTTRTAGTGSGAGATFPAVAPVAGPDGIATGTAGGTRAEDCTSAPSTVAAIAGSLPAVAAVAADASGPSCRKLVAAGSTGTAVSVPPGVPAVAAIAGQGAVTAVAAIAGQAARAAGTAHVALGAESGVATVAAVALLATAAAVSAGSTGIGRAGIG